MRSHGVTDFPDPTVGSNGLPTWTISVYAESPGYRGAQQACKKDLPNLGPQTAAERATTNAEALKYATCVRSNGVPEVSATVGPRA